MHLVEMPENQQYQRGVCREGNEAARLQSHAVSEMKTNADVPTQFDFLGFTFRKRAAKKADGRMFTGFSPGSSNKAKKAGVRKMRGWQMHKLTTRSIGDTAGRSMPNTRVVERPRRIL